MGCSGKSGLFFCVGIKIHCICR